MKSIKKMQAFALLFFSLMFTTNVGAASCGGTYVDYGYYGNNQCPGGAYDCYYDLQGNYYRQSYLPITRDNNVKYACLESDDPASCS